MRYDIFWIVPETWQWRWEESRSNQAIENYKILTKYCSSQNLDIQKLEDVEFDSIYTKFLEENWLVSSEFALLRLSRNSKPEHYIAQTDENLLNENWMDISVRWGVTDFEHEKNERILERIFNWLTEPLDIVLDYHLWSGTTSAVAHKMQRQYIGIEQMDYLNTISIPRLKKVIDWEQEWVSKNVKWKWGWNFVYLELKKSNQEYIDTIQNSEKNEELMRIYEVIKESGFVNYTIDIKGIDENIDEFRKLSIEDQKRFLIELLDKNMLYVNMSEIDDIKNGVSDEEKKINRDFYNVK